VDIDLLEMGMGAGASSAGDTHGIMIHPRGIGHLPRRISPAVRKGSPVLLSGAVVVAHDQEDLDGLTKILSNVGVGDDG
jgi:hypothetical protein